MTNTITSSNVWKENQTNQFVQIIKTQSEFVESYFLTSLESRK